MTELEPIDPDRAVDERARLLLRAREMPFEDGVDDALGAWAEFERHAPGALEAHKPVASLLLRAGRAAEALERLESLDPIEPAAASTLRVRALQRLGRYDEALRVLDARDTDPDVALVALAVKIEREHGREEAAMRRLTSARERCPENEKLIALTLAGQRFRSCPASVLELTESLPSDLLASRAIALHHARALFATGRYEQVETACRDAIDRGSEDRRLFVLRARAAQSRLDAADGAETATATASRWNEVLARWPEDEEALWAGARVAVEHGSRTEAETALGRCLESFGVSRVRKLVSLQGRFARRFDAARAIASEWTALLDESRLCRADAEHVALTLARLEVRDGEMAGALDALDRLPGGLDSSTEARVLGLRALFKLGRFSAVCARAGDIDSFGEHGEAALGLVFDASMRGNDLDRARALCESAAARSSPARSLMLEIGRAHV